MILNSALTLSDLAIGQLTLSLTQLFGIQMLGIPECARTHARAHTHTHTHTLSILNTLQSVKI